MRPALCATTVYNALVVSSPLARSPWFRRAWESAWFAAASRLEGNVVTRLHGRLVWLNAGYSYPAFRRRWPYYNEPLVALVRAASSALGRPVSVIDVGAAIGDTALLLLARASGAVDSIDCVEGDPDFFAYLKANLGSERRVRLHHAMLSDRDRVDARSLVRIHPGTASPQGAPSARATSLDALMAAVASAHVDVLKTDVDGYDGRVLAGATHLTSSSRPAVIFEWHPLLCRAAGEDWFLPFDTLTRAGYGIWGWFTKYGTFSHVTDNLSRDTLANLAEACLEGRGPAPDWHYDVVAVPADSPLAKQVRDGLGVPKFAPLRERPPVHAFPNAV